jgi:hypothetical protein
VHCLVLNGQDLVDTNGTFVEVALLSLEDNLCTVQKARTKHGISVAGKGAAKDCTWHETVSL